MLFTVHYHCDPKTARLNVRKAFKKYCVELYNEHQTCMRMYPGEGLFPEGKGLLELKRIRFEDKFFDDFEEAKDFCYQQSLLNGYPVAVKTNFVDEWDLTRTPRKQWYICGCYHG